MPSQQEPVSNQALSANTAGVLLSASVQLAPNTYFHSYRVYGWNRPQRRLLLKRAGRLQCSLAKDH